MKSRNDEATQRVLLLLKLDANNLFKRVKNRKSEYLEIFALRRTRDHFPKIFDNRYESTTIEDLSHCGTDLITSLDQFYTHVEEMSWYLYQTQDMPNTVEDFIDRKIIRLEKVLATLNLFLDAELGFETEALKSTEADFSEESAFEDTTEEFQE